MSQRQAGRRAAAARVRGRARYVAKWRVWAQVSRLRRVGTQGPLRRGAAPDGGDAASLDAQRHRTCLRGAGESARRAVDMMQVPCGQPDGLLKRGPRDERRSCSQLPRRRCRFVPSAGLLSVLLPVLLPVLWGLCWPCVATFCVAGSWVMGHVLLTPCIAVLDLWYKSTSQLRTTLASLHLQTPCGDHSLLEIPTNSFAKTLGKLYRATKHPAILPARNVR